MGRGERKCFDSMGRSYYVDLRHVEPTRTGQLHIALPKPKDCLLWFFSRVIG